MRLGAGIGAVGANRTPVGEGEPDRGGRRWINLGGWHFKDCQIDRFALKGSGVGLNSMIKIGHDMDFFR